MKKLGLLLVAMLVAISASAVATTSYYVAGDAALCNGENWVPGAAANELTGDPLSITLSDVAVGTYNFKITVGEWPTEENGLSDYGFDAVDATCSDDYSSNGTNVAITLTSAGDVTISFDPATEKICVTGPFGDLVIDSYTLIGDPLIFGTDFEPADTNNDMIADQPTAGIWGMGYQNVTLDVGSYDYKVVGNHAYSAYEYPGSGVSQSIDILEAGTYDIAFTFSGMDAAVVSLEAEAVIATSIDDAQAAVVSAAAGLISADGELQIFTMTGVDVTAQNGQLKGNYIVKVDGGAASVISVQ